MVNPILPTVAQNHVVEDKPKEDIGTYIAKEAIKSEGFPAIRAKMKYAENPAPKLPQKESVRLPKRGSQDEKILQQRLRAIALPDLRLLKSPADMDTAISAFSDSFYEATSSLHPRAVKKLAEIERLNQELHILSVLKQPRDLASVSSLIGKLRKSKPLFSSWNSTSLPRCIKDARRLIGRSLRDAKRSRARRRVAPRKVDLAEEFRASPKDCFDKIKNGDGSKKCTISEASLTEHILKECERIKISVTAHGL